MQGQNAHRAPLFTQKKRVFRAVQGNKIIRTERSIRQVSCIKFKARPDMSHSSLQNAAIVYLLFAAAERPAEKRTATAARHIVVIGNNYNIAAPQSKANIKNLAQEKTSTAFYGIAFNDCMVKPLRRSSQNSSRHLPLEGEVNREDDSTQRGDEFLLYLYLPFEGRYK